MEKREVPIKIHRLYNIEKKNKSWVLVFWDFDKKQTDGILKECHIQADAIKVNYGWAIIINDQNDPLIDQIKTETNIKEIEIFQFDAIPR